AGAAPGPSPLPVLFLVFSSPSPCPSALSVQFHSARTRRSLSSCPCSLEQSPTPQAVPSCQGVARWPSGNSLTGGDSLGGRALLQGTGQEERERPHSLARAGYLGEFLPRKGGQALAEDAQGGLESPCLEMSQEFLEFHSALPAGVKVGSNELCITPRILGCLGLHGNVKKG
uniref:Uncharacterized protein n=1 Tax=Malurus cyaneus samueli TaxID=2593467 RepID=A0A8C5UJK3_9PASS